MSVLAVAMSALMVALSDMHWVDYLVAESVAESVVHLVALMVE